MLPYYQKNNIFQKKTSLLTLVNSKDSPHLRLWTIITTLLKTNIRNLEKWPNSGKWKQTYIPTSRWSINFEVPCGSMLVFRGCNFLNFATTATVAGDSLATLIPSYNTHARTSRRRQRRCRCGSENPTHWGKHGELRITMNNHWAGAEHPQQKSWNFRIFIKPHDFSKETQVSNSSFTSHDKKNSRNQKVWIQISDPFFTGD